MLFLCRTLSLWAGGGCSIIPSSWALLQGRKETGKPACILQMLLPVTGGVWGVSSFPYCGRKKYILKLFAPDWPQSPVPVPQQGSNCCQGAYKGHSQEDLGASVCLFDFRDRAEGLQGPERAPSFPAAHGGCCSHLGFTRRRLPAGSRSCNERGAAPPSGHQQQKGTEKHRRRAGGL